MPARATGESMTPRKLQEGNRNAVRAVRDGPKKRNQLNSLERDGTCGQADQQATFDKLSSSWLDRTDGHLPLHHTVMFSAIVRRVVQPSLRQVRPYTHIRSVATSSTSSPSKLDKGEQAIYEKLSERFQPSELLVQDVSGAPLTSHTYRPSLFNCCKGGCGSFYAITIASTAFKGIPVVKQHRLVNEALKKEIEGIHGLQVRTWLPTIHLIF